MSKRKLGASPALGAAYNGVDLYGDVAKEYNVARADVKAISFPLMYSFNIATSGTKFMHQQIRNQVEMALATGLIKRIK